MNHVQSCCGQEVTLYNLKILAQSLLYQAEKYELIRLNALCEEQLKGVAQSSVLLIYTV